jgi:hypothetical protein
MKQSIKCTCLKQSINSQEKPTFIKFTTVSSNLAAASFQDSRSTTTHNKPYGDDEFLKQVWLSCLPKFAENPVLIFPFILMKAQMSVTSSANLTITV